MRDWREQLAATLQRDGHAVTTVASYGEALGELRRSEYQMVIVDLRLSPTDEDNRDGMILLQDLAVLRIPAIVVTGYGTAELARRAFRDYAAVDFLEKKDLDLKKLRQVVKDAFRKAEEMEKELAELRARFLRGEIITLPQNRLQRVLREKPEEYDKQ
jgi:DNA-binding NtrC family response regulator